MRYILHIIAFILPTVSTFSQGKISQMDITSTLSENERRDLDRFLWSYTKERPPKNDRSIFDFNAIDNWQVIGGYMSISPNGKYFAYTIENRNRITNGDGELDSLIIQSTSNRSRQVFADAKTGFFTNDSKYYIFRHKDDLCFLKLGGNQSLYIRDVASYKVPDNGRNEWLVYRIKTGICDAVLRNVFTGKERRFCQIGDYSFDASGEWLVCQIDSGNYKTGSRELLVYHLATGTERRFPFVTAYSFAKNGKAILLKTAEVTPNGNVEALKYVDLMEGKTDLVWSSKQKGISICGYSIDDVGKQVVFCIQDSSGTISGMSGNSIWYYRKGLDKAVLKVSNNMPNIDAELQISGLVSFLDNGRYIQFGLQPKVFPKKPGPSDVLMDVWNYKDLIIQCTQAYFVSHPQLYNNIISIKNDQIIQLENRSRSSCLLQGDFAVVKKSSRDIHHDRFWDEGYGINKDSNWLVSLSDNRWELLPTAGGDGTLWFSPSGRYLVYFDVKNGCHYFSYDLRTRKLVDISANIPDGQLGFVARNLRTEEKPEHALGLAGWLDNDKGLLVYDGNDLWKLDLSGDKFAVNITNGFGRSHNIIFSLINSQRFTNIVPILNEKGSLLLSAFNIKNKCNGFYRKISKVATDPELLSTGRYFMNRISWCHDPNLSNSGMLPVKARDADTWIVQRQSGRDGPNYYRTSDFRTFDRLTNHQPHKRFSWFSEELHSFKHLDGKEGQGILYKPENFDSSKRYPVLIIFYGAYSNNLYQFPVPTYNTTAVTPGRSPVWFVNNGYLVFTPDIYVSPLKYGPEAFNVIEGAARYLKQLPYVDADGLACCSHSWSAKLGSYLFTHSKSFAAMAISEGFLYANMINVAFSTDDYELSRLVEVEKGFQFGSFWENRESWLDQTTVLNVDKAHNPLLLLCNKESPKEYQNQTLQLFNSLRRLDKKVWWLKYDKGGHTLDDVNEQKDYTIRYTQFFDHYLRQAPAPKWMTQSIPYTLRGIVSKYELDPAGTCSLPGKDDCPICKKWNDQYRRYPEMFAKPISEWYLIKDGNNK